MSENIDVHVLAGFRCVDATTSLSIEDPLRIQAAPLVLRRNNSGIFAVMDAPGVSRRATQSLSPAAASWPAPVNFEIRIDDPAGRYLSRRAMIAAPQPLPREITQVTATTTTTAAAQPPALPPVTTPQQVVMYPSPAAALGPNWAVVRVTVSSNAATPAPLPWAIVQISGIPGLSPAGVTNNLGEALLAVPGLGLKLSSSASGSVTEAMTAATATVWFDLDSLKQPPGWVANPDVILQDRSNSKWKTASEPVQLGPGQTSFVKFSISVT
jgi:hypothetical protein